MPEEEKIEFVYRYVMNHVEFDQENLIRREKELNYYNHRYNEIPEFKKKKFAMIHSSYSALMMGKSNCEGSVNLMRFLLNLLHINSFNVHCIDLKNNVNDLNNHAMIRIYHKGNWYYCDPMMARNEGDKNLSKYYMRTYDEMKQMNRYRFNAFEAQIQKENMDAKQSTFETRTDFKPTSFRR